MGKGNKNGMKEVKIKANIVPEIILPYKRNAIASVEEISLKMLMGSINGVGSINL